MSQAKAITGLITAAGGVAVAFNWSDASTIDGIIAAVTPLVVYGLTWLVPNKGS